MTLVMGGRQHAASGLEVTVAVPPEPCARLPAGRPARSVRARGWLDGALSLAASARCLRLLQNVLLTRLIVPAVADDGFQLMRWLLEIEAHVLHDGQGYIGMARLGLTWWMWAISVGIQCSPTPP